MQKDYLGASIGLSFLGSAPQIGINYEHSMELQNFGRVGIGGIFRYWSYSELYESNGNWNYTVVLIGAQGNYHFQLDNEFFDPWVGLVLAYDAGSVSWDSPDYNYSSPTYGGFFSWRSSWDQILDTTQFSSDCKDGFWYFKLWSFGIRS